MTMPAPSRPRLAVAGAALAIATAVLVAAGVLTRVDQFAVSHLMPWVEPGRARPLTFGALALPRLDGPLPRALLDLWTYPAALVPSLVVVLLCALRSARPVGAAWCALWLGGNVLELVGKSTISRPALYAAHARVESFDASLPSGHTIRALVVAAAVASTWRFGRYALVWAAGVLPALVVLGAHVPTDVAAGLFVALALAGWAPLRVSAGRPRGRPIPQSGRRSPAAPSSRAER